MRFRVERNEFTDAVSWTARTLPAGRPRQLQVLAGLMLDTTDDGLRLPPFDYEVGARGDGAGCGRRVPGAHWFPVASWPRSPAPCRLPPSSRGTMRTGWS